MPSWLRSIRDRGSSKPTKPALSTIPSQARIITPPSSGSIATTQTNDLWSRHTRTFRRNSLASSRTVWNLALRTIKLCLEHGADPLETTNAGETIFHLILRSFRECEYEDRYSSFRETDKRLECITFCLSLGVNTQAENCAGIRPVEELSYRNSSYNSAFLFNSSVARLNRMDSIELIR